MAKRKRKAASEAKVAGPRDAKRKKKYVAAATPTKSPGARDAKRKRKM